MTTRRPPAHDAPTSGPAETPPGAGDGGGPSLRDALDRLGSLVPAEDELPDDEPAPAFLLAAGWRSGSTLLQRALMPEVFLWGEPYGHACPIPALAETLRAFTASWPEPGFFHRGEPAAELVDRPIANLYPPIADLRQSHRALLRTLLEAPARRAGSRRWGLKEVRLSIDHARYLKWLFPRAKFLFLHRDPRDAYRSLAARRADGVFWYRRWPGEPVDARLFARHWRELALRFLDGCAEVGGLLLSYADLAAGTVGAVEDYLGCPLSREAFAARPPDGPPPLASIPPADAAVLERELGDAPAALGYSRPGSPLAKQAEVKCEPVERSKCAILVPVGSHPDRRCEEALRGLEALGYVVRRAHGFANVDQARNQLATDALRDGFLDTVWVDADVAFRPDAVDRLRAHGEPLIGGIYPKKGARALACRTLPGTTSLTFGAGGGVVELLYAATGFLRVHRRVYEDVRSRLPVPLANQGGARPTVPFFQPLIRPLGAGHWYLGDDYSFCHRARAAGSRVTADTPLRLWHVGERLYGWEDAGIGRERFDTFTLRLGEGGPNDG